MGGGEIEEIAQSAEKTIKLLVKELDNWPHILKTFYNFHCYPKQVFNENYKWFSGLGLFPRNGTTLLYITLQGYAKQVRLSFHPETILAVKEALFTLSPAKRGIKSMICVSGTLKVSQVLISH